MKKILKFLFALVLTIATAVIASFSASGHSLTPWANVYTANNAGNSYQFAIFNSYHIDGNTVNYYWANTTASDNFSAAMTGGINMWEDLINGAETDASNAHVKVSYNPNIAAHMAAYVVAHPPSIGHHYGPDDIVTEMVLGNITDYDESSKTKIFGHELGHLWGIDDLYSVDKTDLESIYSAPYSFNTATRHDKNAMRIALNKPMFDTGNGWKYQTSAGVWANNEDLEIDGAVYTFNSSGLLVSMNLADGVYEIQGKTSGKAIHATSTAEGASAHLYESGTSDNHKFNFERQNDGTYKITLLSSSYVLDNFGSSNNIGIQLKFYDWSGDNNQRWYVIDCGNGYVKFINKHSGHAIDIRGNEIENHTVIQQYTNSNVDAQSFKLLPKNLPEISINLANGIYEIQGKTSEKFIHTENTDEGALAQLNQQLSTDNQRFNFERQSDGTYKITVLSNNYALDTPGLSYTIGTQLKFYSWNGGNNQRWYVVDCEDGYVKFINKHSGLAIDIRNNGTENGTAIQQYTDENVDAQKFKLLLKNLPDTSINLANGVYEIQGKTSGKAIHATSAAKGALAHLYESGTSDNQKFNFERQSDGTYKITVLSSNYVLDNPGPSDDIGVQLKFYDWNGGNNQRWYVVDCEDGYVKFINKHSGLTIDIRNNGTENGTAIQQYTDENVDAQKFKLLPKSLPVRSMYLANGVYTIQGKTSGRNIHTTDAVEGASAHLYQAGSSDNEKFNFERQSDGTYKITVLSSNCALSNPGLSYAKGTQLKFYAWNGENHQRWFVIDCGDGYVKFINKHSGLTIDIKYDGMQNKTPVQQYTDEDTDAQRFKLLPKNLPVRSMYLANGVYTIQGKTSGRNIHTTDSVEGASAHLYQAGSADNEKFNFERQSDGTYKITVLSSNCALSNPGLSYAKGTQLKFYAWNGENHQRWFVIDCGDGYVKFINKHSGLTIDIKDDATENKTPVQQYTDEGTDAQRFKLLPKNLPVRSMALANGIYEIQGKTSEKFIHVENTDEGAFAFINQQSSTDNQRFNFERQSDGTYKITVLSSNYVLSNPGLSYVKETQLKFYAWNGENHQRWFVIDCGDGYVKFINKHSGLTIDIKYDGMQNKTPVQQYTDEGTDAQRFKLLPVA